MKSHLVNLGLAAMAVVASAAHADCAAMQARAHASGIRITGSTSGRTVIGKERLQFFSAPSPDCIKRGVFVVPGDLLNAYIEHDGFTVVMYLNPQTGQDVEGWVRSSRLKENGYGISPQQ